MSDQDLREKVIEGLQACTKGEEWPCCEECPYADEDGTCFTLNTLMSDALALLKAQEQVEPTEPDEDNTRYCGACGSPIGYEVLEPPGLDYIQYNYCPTCGRAVKWE